MVGAKSMKYFKSAKGAVSAYNEDGSQDHLIKDGMVEMTAQEVEAHINPVPAEKSIQDQIEDLENTVTPRNYREFVMGNQYSIDKINKVEADIAILRAKL